MYLTHSYSRTAVHPKQGVLRLLQKLRETVHSTVLELQKPNPARMNKGTLGNFMGRTDLIESLDPSPLPDWEDTVHLWRKVDFELHEILLDLGKGKHSEETKETVQYLIPQLGELDTRLRSTQETLL